MHMLTNTRIRRLNAIVCEKYCVCLSQHTDTLVRPTLQTFVFSIFVSFNFFLLRLAVVQRQYTIKTFNIVSIANEYYSMSFVQRDLKYNCSVDNKKTNIHCFYH